MNYPEKNVRPVLYSSYYTLLRKIAIKNGYALAIHGSMERDFDLVAIPWVEDCASPADLAYKMADFLGSVDSLTSAEKKPFGRLAYTFQVGGDGGYIDLSVLPKVYERIAIG